MKKRFKLLVGLAVLASTVAISSGAAHAAPAAPPPAADARGYDGFVDFLVGAGSDTTYPVEQEFEVLYNHQNGCIPSATDVGLGGVQNEYNECSNGAETAGDTENENWDHDVVVNAFPAGSGAGQRQLADGNTAVGCDTDPAGYEVDFARSSSDQGTGGIYNCLTFFGYAKDGLNVLTFQGRAPLDFNIGGGGDLDLANIFSNQDGQCLTRTWSELTGNPADTARVEVYGIQTSSGTYISFNNAIPGDPNACAVAQGHAACFENNVMTNPVVGCSAAALNNVNTIWWGSYGDLATFSGRRGSASLSNSIDGIAASADSIRGVTGAPFFDDAYPLTRFMWRVNRTAHVDTDGVFNATYTAAAGGRAGAAAAYTEWLCRNGGHGIDPNTGADVDTLITQTLQSNNYVRTPTQQTGVNPYGRCLVDY